MNQLLEVHVLNYVMKSTLIFLIWFSVIVPSCRHTTDHYPAYKLIPKPGGIREKEGQEALQILEKVLAMTARVNENRASNAYEARVLSTMADIADENLLLALNGFAANRIAVKTKIHCRIQPRSFPLEVEITGSLCGYGDSMRWR